MEFADKLENPASSHVRAGLVLHNKHTPKWQQALSSKKVDCTQGPYPTGLDIPTIGIDPCMSTIWPGF